MPSARTINILFATSKLASICNDPKLANKQLGGRRAKILGRRLDDLPAACTLAEMAALPGRFHARRSDRAGQFAIDLDQPCRLVLAPADDPVATLPDGSVDCTRVTAVCILEIVNYHG